MTSDIAKISAKAMIRITKGSCGRVYNPLGSDNSEM